MNDSYEHIAQVCHETKEHPCFVPYEELPPEQRMKDYLFGAICAAYFAHHKSGVK